MLCVCMCLCACVYVSVICLCICGHVYVCVLSVLSICGYVFDCEYTMCVCVVYRVTFGVVCVSLYGVPVCELYVCMCA